MTIDEILEKIKIEKTFGSRFPLRIIFCNTLDSYFKIIDAIQEMDSDCFSLVDHYSDENLDTLPKIRKSVDDFLSSSKDIVLLTGCGEYLRFTGRIEKNGEGTFTTKIWELTQSENSKKRLYVPVFAAKDIVLGAIGDKINDLRRKSDCLWDLDEDVKKNYILTLYSDDCRSIIEHENRTTDENKYIFSFSSWLDIGLKSFKNFDHLGLVTKQSEYCEKTEKTGISIRIINSAKEYVEQIDSDMHNIVSNSNYNRNWAKLAIYLKDNHLNYVKDAILKSYNMMEFDAPQILAGWEERSFQQKWYFWLWYRIKDVSGYVSSVMQNLNEADIDKIPNFLINEFSKIEKPSESQREEFDSIKNAIENNGKAFVSQNVKKELKVTLENNSPLERIKLTKAVSYEEKQFIFKSCTEYLQDSLNNSPQKIAELISALELSYPEFSYYLKSNPENYQTYTNYFEWYKKNKITLASPEKPFEYPDLEITLKSRTSKFQKLCNEHFFAFWVDGMGAEWLSLISEILDKEKDSRIPFTYSIDIAKSRLPSETMFNQQWNYHSENIKKNELDKINHNGIIDDSSFYSAFAKQIELIVKYTKEAISYLNSYDTVVMTADHGSSRLAALAFHKYPGIKPAKGIKSCDFGRYAEVQEEISISSLPDYQADCENDGKHYIVMKDYNHFVQSGNAAGNIDGTEAGEVHGGFTPEECIVPFVIIRKKVEIKNETNNDLHKGIKLNSMGGLP